ncbi:histidine kinase dimerization/phosphoacceptor domain-containing protein [Pseudonocardia spinosispora]|uniref:histidine kinase dimerization/phosphoacceptor domain-containing protein n=1 Tax=Pseudonocardia spinosispora TaxID=103441 RepID=UPI000A04A4CA
MARDLHDGLAHQLPGLLLQVQTAQAILTDGDAVSCCQYLGWIWTAPGGER